jgi:hypothetical protein
MDACPVDFATVTPDQAKAAVQKILDEQAQGR